MKSRDPNSLAEAVREHVRVTGRSPCSFGFAMAKDLYECLARARAHLDERFAQPLCLADLARVAGVSPFHFQRLFKEFFGQSPNEHQRRMRLCAARDLILNGMSVTEACFEVGFQSPSSFSRFYKREFGVPPANAKPRV
jgi:AraC-like DNA-binding protein